MKKFVSIVSLSLAAVGIASGCAVEAADSPEEGAFVGAGEEAACSNPDGTNVMLASLASTISLELGRWDILSDFELYRGLYNQEYLRIRTQTVGSRQAVNRAIRCKNGCRGIDALLTYQDPDMDGKFLFPDGSKLNSWTFASRLATGYRNQTSCEGRPSNDANTCKGAEDHFLEKVGMVDATCGGVDYGVNLLSLKATKGVNGAEVSPEALLASPNKLMRRLVWANGSDQPNQQVNPFLQFSVTDGSTVVVDPYDGTGEQPPPPPAQCVAQCNWTDAVDANGAPLDLSTTCCVCGYNGMFKRVTGTPRRPPPPNAWSCQP